MKSITKLLGGSLLAFGLLGQPVLAADKAEPIKFGALTWESGSLITEVLRTVVEKGYGYSTVTLPGSTVSLKPRWPKTTFRSSPKSGPAVARCGSRLKLTARCSG